MKYWQAKKTAFPRLFKKFALLSIAFSMWVWAFLIFRNDYLGSRVKDLEKGIKRCDYQIDTLPGNLLQSLYDGIKNDFSIRYAENGVIHTVKRGNSPVFLEKHPKATPLDATSNGYFLTAPLKLSFTDTASTTGREYIPGISFEKNPKNPYKMQAQLMLPKDTLTFVYHSIFHKNKGFYKSEREFREAIKSQEYAQQVYEWLVLQQPRFINSTTAEWLLAFTGHKPQKQSKEIDFTELFYNYVVVLDTGYATQFSYSKFLRNINNTEFIQQLYRDVYTTDNNFFGFFNTAEELQATLLKNKVEEETKRYLMRKITKPVVFKNSRKPFNDSVPVFEFVPFERFKQLLTLPDYKDKLYAVFSQRYDLASKREFEYNLSAGARYEKDAVAMYPVIRKQKEDFILEIAETNKAKLRRKKIVGVVGYSYLIILVGLLLRDVIKFYLLQVGKDE